MNSCLAICPPTRRCGGRRALGAKRAASLPLSIALSALVATGTGCSTVQEYSLTCKLWDTHDFTSWNEPAPDSKLALFETADGADLLVQYDALSDRHSDVIRQAYLLEENRLRLESGKKPRLVPPEQAEHLRAVPVVRVGAAITNPAPPAPTYAVCTNTGRTFVLYRPGASPLGAELPVYCESSGTPVRIALTPLAVAGDTAMLGGVLAVVGFFMWVEGGAPVR
ncbi:MAG TPA: hypothetical protein VMU04_04930 [Candidatus Acidoferrum sp.]|nr:hypothetical protein [Candidatus Acidoferrum sp.]